MLKNVSYGPYGSKYYWLRLQVQNLSINQNGQDTLHRYPQRTPGPGTVASLLQPITRFVGQELQVLFPFAPLHQHRLPLHRGEHAPNREATPPRWSSRAGSKHRRDAKKCKRAIHSQKVFGCIQYSCVSMCIPIRIRNHIPFEKVLTEYVLSGFSVSNYFDTRSSDDQHGRC